MRHFLRTGAFIVALVAMLLVLSSASTAQNDIIRLTNNSYSDLYPKIGDDGHIVWECLPNSPADNTYEVCYYDGSSVTQLSDNSYANGSPDINSGGQVVWVGDDQPGESNIFFFDGSGTVRLTDGAHADSPKINNQGRIVWTDYDGAGYSILLDDGNTIRNISAALGNVTNWGPSMNDKGQVAWEAFVDGNWKIAFYDGTQVRVLDPVTAGTPKYPDINDSGQITWNEVIANNNYRAVLYDGSTRQIISSSINPGAPQLNDQGQAVWGDNYGEVWLYDPGYNGSGPQPHTRALTSGHRSGNPSINDLGHVVFQSYATVPGYIEIYYFDGANTRRITDNNFHDDLPVINNSDQMAWEGWLAEGYEIFTLRASALKPDLRLASTGTYWASYADYQSRQLSLGFSVMNNGTTGIQDLSIASADLTNGVAPGAGQLPMDVGALSGGATAQFTIRFDIPDGVAAFNVTLHGTAIDAAGTSYTYP